MPLKSILSEVGSISFVVTVYSYNFLSVIFVIGVLVISGTSLTFTTVTVNDCIAVAPILSVASITIE